MVVTRKTPLVPAPPSSRTNSSQPIPRNAKGKAPRTVSNAPEPSSPLVNGESRAEVPESASNDESKNKNAKGKHKSKGKKHGKKKKSPSLVDVLLRFLLLFFTIYTFSVCPNDTALQSPICRGLYEYRRLVLEPLILPPINFALAHPSVSPYVTRVKSHYYTLVEAVAPAVVRTQVEWNTRIVPQWNTYGAPQLVKLDSKLDPYRNRIITEYNTRLAPHIFFVASRLQFWQVHATPYVQLLASKTHTGYKKAAPYAKPVWTRVKAVMTQVLIKARELRREFVDPHVARIWEKVVELSSGKQSGSLVKEASEPEAAAQVSMSDVPEVKTADATTVQHESTIVAHEEATTDTVSTSLAFDSVITSSNVVSSSSVLPSVSESSVTARSEQIAPSSDSTSSASPVSIESGSIPAKSSSSSVSAKQAPESASSDVSASASVLSVVSSLTDEISSVVAPPTATGDAEDDIDLDEFYMELELESSSDHVPFEAAQPQLEDTLTEEQQAEEERLHKIQVAKKRADIEGRHTNWEESVSAMSVSMGTQLRTSLSDIRKAALAELKQSPLIKGELDGLVKDAEKFLKGAEAYYKNLKKDDAKGEEEKESLWVKVIGRVEEKFRTKLGEAEAAVNAWYAGILNKELQEVQSAVFAVKDIADRGQADIGLDYAWLDDVTVDDWKRYHDLMRSHQNFTIEANMIQNGSHPTAPPNPVLHALHDLQTEVQDIVMGFQTQLRQLKRDGQQTFGGADPLIDDDSPLPSEPEVSILPIPGDDHLNTEAGRDGPSIVIGRSKQEVLEALGKVENQTKVTEAQDATHMKNDPEEVVESIEREASAAQSPTATASRVEL